MLGAGGWRSRHIGDRDRRHTNILAACPLVWGGEEKKNLTGVGEKYLRKGGADVEEKTEFSTVL